MNANVTDLLKYKQMNEYINIYRNKEISCFVHLLFDTSMGKITF